MRAVLVAVFVVAVPGVAPAADPPAKKVEPPFALLEFSRDRTLDAWTTTFEMTTASGASYELVIDFGDRGNIYDEEALKPLLLANWIAEPTDNRSVKIYGARTKGGKADAVKTLTITNKLRAGMGQMPIVTGYGGAKAEVKTDDGKAKPDAKRKAPPKGPTFPGETFVEFDVSTLPAGQRNVHWDFEFEVLTTAGEKEPSLRVPIEVNSEKAGEILLDMLDSCFAGSGFKIEVVGKAKLRVYGGVYEGRYYPAVRGTVVSPHLKREQLPKITNPPRL